MTCAHVLFQSPAERGRLRAWPVHGGRALGHGDVLYCGVAPQGAVPADARNLHTRRHTGQTGGQECVRLPCLQDKVSI